MDHLKPLLNLLQHCFSFMFLFSGMWDLSFPARDQTCNPCTGRQILTTESPGKSLRVVIIKIQQHQNFHVKERTEKWPLFFLKASYHAQSVLPSDLQFLCFFCISLHSKWITQKNMNVCWFIFFYLNTTSQLSISSLLPATWFNLI